jgi:lysophospholipase L1-like esterase
VRYRHAQADGQEVIAHFTKLHADTMKSFTLLALLWIGDVLAIPCQAAGKSRFVSNLEAGKPQVIVTYGTSLTAEGAWVKQMGEVLKKQYPKLSTVINSGGSGKWSQRGVENLDARVIQKKPDTVFIEFSMNDAAEIFHVSIETAKANLENMTRTARCLINMSPMASIPHRKVAPR